MRASKVGCLLNRVCPLLHPLPPPASSWERRRFGFLLSDSGLLRGRARERRRLFSTWLSGRRPLPPRPSEWRGVVGCNVQAEAVAMVSWLAPRKRNSRMYFSVWCLILAAAPGSARVGGRTGHRAHGKCLVTNLTDLERGRMYLRPYNNLNYAVCDLTKLREGRVPQFFP